MTPSRLDAVVPTTLYPGIVGVTVVRRLAIGELPKKRTRVVIDRAGIARA